MSFSVNTNITSLQAQNYLRQTSDFQSKTINKVTSGLRIVQSGDDAAGLAVANGYRSDEAVLTQGVRNANDGLSTLQTVDGGMSNISTLLDRARTLATQSASGTFTGDRTVLNSEFQSVVGEINRQAQAIGLNTGGQFAKNLSVFVGGGKSSNGTSAISNGSIGVDLSASTVDAKSLGLQGVQATGTAGTDIGNGSASTSVSKILADTKNTTATTGYTDFYVQGSGFAGGNKVNLHVNLSGVTDSSTLATAVNAAIATAGNGATQAATAFKNANITASVTTDSSGKQQLSFNSSNAAFQVQAGDRMSNALMGNFGAKAAATGTLDLSGVSGVSGGVTTTNSTDDTLTLSVNGGTTINVKLADAANVLLGTANTGIVDQLNNDANFKTVAKASVDSTGNHLVITALNDVVGSSITISNNTLAQNLGIAGTFTATATTGKDTTNTVSTTTAADATAGFAGGTAATNNAVVRIQGGGLDSPVDIVLKGATDTTTGAAAADLVTQASTNAALQAAGISVSYKSGTGLTFTSTRGESLNVSSAGDVNNQLGLGNYVSGSDSTKFESTTVTAGVVATAGGAQTDKIEFSIAGGKTAEISVTDGGGSAQQLVDNLNTQLSKNASTSAAGISATLGTTGSDTGKIILTSKNGTAFRVAEGDGATAGNQILGFGSGVVTAVAAGAAGAVASTSTSSTDNVHVDAGGSAATSVFQFSSIQNGQDSQTVDIAANDASGGAHRLSVVLSNNSTARNARSLDEAVATINTQLQTSNDSTLRQVVAVKDTYTDKSGTLQEGIRFLSTLNSFSVGVGSAGTGSMAGLAVPATSTTAAQQGTVVDSTNLSGGGSVDISNQTTAAAAVTALAAAVSTLGSAQAVVGKGENVLNYAVNLAQSQLTNEASAESRIRDADLASEAANLTKAQILVQAGVAALAQANSAPQQVLSLLKG